MILIDKEHHECQIIDFAIPFDTRVYDVKVEKTEKYLDLARELKKVWNMKVTVVPLVAGALGTPAKGLEKRLKTKRFNNNKNNNNDNNNSKNNNDNSNNNNNSHS